jgi:hypothetical protein
MVSALSAEPFSSSPRSAAAAAALGLFRPATPPPLPPVLLGEGRGHDGFPGEATWFSLASSIFVERAREGGVSPACSLLALLRFSRFLCFVDSFLSLHKRKSIDDDDDDDDDGREKKTRALSLLLSFFSSPSSRSRARASSTSSQRERGTLVAAQSPERERRKTAKRFRTRLPPSIKRERRQRPSLFCALFLPLLWHLRFSLP